MERFIMFKLVFVLPVFLCCEARTWDCPLMLESCELLNGIQGDKGIKGEPGLPGIVGTPGLPGYRGDPGDPGSLQGGGTINIKGAKGDRGLPGRKGSPGQRGPIGGQGDTGDIGLYGRKGLPGRRGNAGSSGFPGAAGDDGDVGNVNWKQCTFTLDVNKQDGEINACTFQKLLNNTALHVTYQGDIHVGLCGTCCKKWEFLFNGRSCLSPGPIDAVYDNLMLVNNNKPSVLPVFSHGSITGYCGNQPSEPVRVSMTIRNCSDFPKDSVHVDTQVTITGRIIIQEVPPQQQ